MASQNSSRTARRRKVIAGGVFSLLTVVVITAGKIGVAYLHTPEKQQDEPVAAVTFEGPVAVDRSDRRSDDHSDDHSITNSNNTANANNSIFVDRRRDDYSDRSVTNRVDQSVHNSTTVVPQQIAPGPQGIAPRRQVAPQPASSLASSPTPQAVPPAPLARGYQPQPPREEVELLGALEDQQERGLVAAEQCATMRECEAEYLDWYAKSCAALRNLDAYVLRQYGRSGHFESEFKFQSPMRDLSALPASEQVDLFKRLFHAYARVPGIYASQTKQMRYAASAR